MGYGGGPAARNPLAESGLRLTLSDLTNGEPLRPHSQFRGRMSWTRFGVQQLTADFAVTTSDVAGSVHLLYRAAPYGGEPLSMDYVIGLVTTEQPSGGVRFWFFCERGRTMCSVLRMMPGSVVFASRQAFRRISYRSQRVSDRDRFLGKAQAIREAMGGSVNLMEPFPEKPPRMHWSTYARKRQKADAAAGASLAILGQHLDRTMPGWRDRVRPPR